MHHFGMRIGPNKSEKIQPKHSINSDFVPPVKPGESCAILVGPLTPVCLMRSIGNLSIFDVCC